MTWKTIYSVRFGGVLFSLIVCFMLGALVVRAQTSGSLSGGVIFTADPTFADGQVTLQMLVRSAGLQRYDLLTESNFAVDESADALQVSSEPTAPMTLIVMVNLSYASDVDLIRSTLRAYVESYYRPGDDVIFYILGANLLERVEPVDLAGLNSLIDGLSASTLYAPIDGMVAAALDRVRAELTENPARAFQTLLVGSYLRADDDPALARGFAALNVPLHVIQAHRFRDDSTDKLRAFAQNGGGLFVNNLNGRFVQSGAPISAVSTLQLAYDAIESSRTIYTLTYRPLRRDLNTAPQVRLRVELDADQRISTDFTYPRTFAAPQLELADDSLDLRRRPRYDEEQVVFDTSEARLNARVVFPDGVPRTLQSLRVEIVNAADGQVLQSELEFDPTIDPLGNFNLTWSLTAFDLPETTTPFRLVVTVTDSLGLTATAAREGSVTVATLPALPTPTPQPTVPPTVTPTPIPSPTLTPEPTALVENAAAASIAAAASSPATPPPRPIDNPLTLLFSVIILVLVLIILLMLLARLRARRRQRVTSGYAPGSEALDTDAGQPTATESARSAPVPADAALALVENKLYGRLIVVRGLNQTEIPITREEFVIGRSETGNCDFVIPAPFVSPRHCMLIHRNGRFSIRDLKAKNGVFVNGERIPLERDVIVPIGSEVGITQNIIVELWDPITVVNTNRSRYGTTTQTHQSQVTGTEHLFRPLLGIRYVDDDDEVSDDYNPV